MNISIMIITVGLVSFQKSHSSKQQLSQTMSQKSLMLFNGMTWSDQNCLTRGAYFEMIFLLKKWFKFCGLLYFLMGDGGTIRLVSRIMRSYCSGMCCSTIRQLNIHCQIIGQLDIHCPTVGQLDTHSRS